MPRTSQSLKFGFDNSQRHLAMHQLQALLKLDNAQSKELKERLWKITLRHFDIDKVGYRQNQALDMAMEDLKSQLPNLFRKGNVEQREFFVRCVILLMHTNRRKREKNKGKAKEAEDHSRSDTDNHSQDNKKIISRPFSSAKPGPSLTERMAANLLSITKGTQAPKIFASSACAPRIVQSSSSSSGPVPTRPSLSDIPPSAAGSLERQQNSPVLPSQTPNPNANARIPLSSISQHRTLNGPVSPSSRALRVSSRVVRSRPIKVENTSFSTPTTSSSNMIAGLFTSTSCGDTQGCSVAARPLRGGQIRSVHKFLEAAIPSMTHLLHRFIEFGCLGEDFLFAVSTWPPDQIRIFLKSLPPGPGGSELTRMEMEILVYHFESYFLASNSKA